MGIKTAMTDCSDSVNRLMWIGLPILGVIWIGFWLLKWKWLEGLGGAGAGLFLYIYMRIEIRFEALQIAAAGMDELQEYIDKRFKARESD